MRSESLSKIVLPEEKIPKFWYNVQADMPTLPKPYLNPVTKQPIGPADLMPIFPMGCIEQEVSTERFIEIPTEVRDIYKSYRPAPVFRAHRLEKALGTNCRIYYKYEGVSPVGSHKLNSALPQVFYNKIAGIKRLATETGAGQWGTALALATSMFGLESTVYMVKVSYDQKPYRRSIMQVYGAEVIASPSNRTVAGRAELERNPYSTGSLGMAISEAVEDAVGRDDTNYSLGSVLNHVCMHQSVIGLEAKTQLEMVDEYPDMVIGCCGGGTNFAGLAFPFVPDKLAGKNIRLIAVEPSGCPTLTRGTFGYDFSDVAGLTPIAEMYSLGRNFAPPSIHAGGLRYHGDSPLVSRLYHDGILEATAVDQRAVFEAAILFARNEGILPAPESSHAIRTAIDEALKCKESGESKCILFGLSGHGHFDLSAYDEYLSDNMQNIAISDQLLEKSFEGMPKI